MPIYHFNIHDGIDIHDDDGHEFADLAEAQREAIALSGNMIRELGAEFWKGKEWTLEVTDHQGLLLFNLIFFANCAPAIE